MPTLKAYACRLRGFQDETIEYADTAGKARYAFLCYILAASVTSAIVAS